MADGFTPRTCSLCDAPHWAKGLCGKHYREDRWKRLDPETRAKYHQASAEKRLAKYDRERDLLDHPSTIRLVALLRTPMYRYDSAERTQAVVVDCIEAIPEGLRRVAFGMRRSKDPFAPIADDVIESSGWSPVTLEVVGWLYGVTKQRIDQVERGALRRLKARPDVRALRDYMDPVVHPAPGIRDRRSA